MNTKMTTAERASLAKSLLENPLLTQIFAEIKEELVYLWEATAWDSIKEREFHWQYMKAVKQLEGRLLKEINEAAVDKQLEEARELARQPGIQPEGE